MSAEIESTFVGQLDRLSALIERFRVQAEVCDLAAARDPKANLLVFRKAGEGLRLAYSPNLRTGAEPCSSERQAAGEVLVVAATIRVMGVGDHLVAALPRCLTVNLTDARELQAVVLPMIAEIEHPRCGGLAVFHRLCEVVVIRLLRHALETGMANFGVLAGLSHPRLAKALVAVHDRPDVDWSLERLASEAGMSRTQFAITFKETVGSTPGAYLSNWRLEVARAELETGGAINKIARNCGFSSAASFSRAFARRYGHTPKAERQKNTI